MFIETVTIVAVIVSCSGGGSALVLLVAIPISLWGAMRR